MLTASVLYGIAGLALFGLGLRATLLYEEVLRKLLGLNVTGAGVFMVLIAAAYRGGGGVSDPVPHALVLTGIVVAVSATALGLALGRRLAEQADD